MPWFVDPCTLLRLSIFNRMVSADFAKVGLSKDVDAAVKMTTVYIDLDYSFPWGYRQIVQLGQEHSWCRCANSPLSAIIPVGPVRKTIKWKQARWTCRRSDHLMELPSYVITPIHPFKSTPFKWNPQSTTVTRHRFLSHQSRIPTRF